MSLKTRRVQFIYNKLKNKLEMCEKLTPDEIYVQLKGIEWLRKLKKREIEGLVLDAIELLIVNDIAKFIKKSSNESYVRSLVHENDLYEPFKFN